VIARIKRLDFGFGLAGFVCACLLLVAHEFSIWPMRYSSGVTILLAATAVCGVMAFVASFASYAVEGRATRVIRHFREIPLDAQVMALAQSDRQNLWPFLQASRRWCHLVAFFKWLLYSMVFLSIVIDYF
jgi:hypothetical protein